jgi:septum formation topological specificity factor MinE
MLGYDRQKSKRKIHLAESMKLNIMRVYDKYSKISAGLRLILARYSQKGRQRWYSRERSDYITNSNFNAIR